MNTYRKMSFGLILFSLLTSTVSAYAEYNCEDVFNTKADYLIRLSKSANPKNEMSLITKISRLDVAWDSNPVEVKNSVSSLLENMKRALSRVSTSKWVNGVDASKSWISGQISWALFARAFSEAEFKAMIDKSFPRMNADGEGNQIDDPIYLLQMKDIYDKSVAMAAELTSRWGSYENYVTTDREIKSLPEMLNEDVINKIISTDSSDVKATASRMFVDRIIQQKNIDGSQTTITMALNEIISASKILDETEYAILIDAIRPALSQAISQNIKKFSYSESDIESIRKVMIDQANEDSVPDHVMDHVSGLFTDSVQISRTQALADAVSDRILRGVRTVKRDVRTFGEELAARFSGHYHKGNTNLYRVKSKNYGVVIIKGTVGPHQVYVKRWHNSGRLYIYQMVDGHEMLYERYANGVRMRHNGTLWKVSAHALKDFLF